MDHLSSEETKRMVNDQSTRNAEREKSQRSNRETGHDVNFGRHTLINDRGGHMRESEDPRGGGR